VGKTLLDVRYASDTMEISLGRDKQVSVSREKTQDYTESQMLGSKKEEFRTWKTTVKNNKSQPVNMIILDQVPVSTWRKLRLLSAISPEQNITPKPGRSNGSFHCNRPRKRSSNLIILSGIPKTGI
jgi:hypothetical protein